MLTQTNLDVHCTVEEGWLIWKSVDSPFKIRTRWKRTMGEHEAIAEAEEEYLHPSHEQKVRGTWVFSVIDGSVACVAATDLLRLSRRSLLRP